MIKRIGTKEREESWIYCVALREGGKRLAIVGMSRYEEVDVIDK